MGAIQAEIYRAPEVILNPMNTTARLTWVKLHL